MIVLDTHAWLWWMDKPLKLSRTARKEIERAERIGVCTVSCYELALLTARGRIDLEPPIDEWVPRALAEQRVEPLGLSPEAAVEAALLDRRRFAGDSVDRIVYATARLEGAVLVTRDERIRRFDRERTVW